MTDPTPNHQPFNDGPVTSPFAWALQVGLVLFVLVFTAGGGFVLFVLGWGFGLTYGQAFVVLLLGTLVVSVVLALVGWGVIAAAGRFPSSAGR